MGSTFGKADHQGLQSRGPCGYARERIYRAAAEISVARRARARRGRALDGPDRRHRGGGDHRLCGLSEPARPARAERVLRLRHGDASGATADPHAEPALGDIDRGAFGSPSHLRDHRSDTEDHRPAGGQTAGRRIEWRCGDVPRRLLRLCGQRRGAGAQRRDARYQARQQGRAGRSFGGRQIDPLQSAFALLRAGVGHDRHRRPGYRRGHARLPAQPHRAGHPGTDPVRRDCGREHRTRPPRCRTRRHRGGRRGGGRRRIHPRIAERLRHASRRRPGRISPAASASASPSRAPCCAMRRSSCSTKPRRR